MCRTWWSAVLGAKALGSPVVYKPLGGIWHGNQGRVRVLYTTPVTDLELLLDPAISRTARLFQEQVPGQFEARAVVVGERVFAMRIMAGSDRARIDWRSDYDSLTYSELDLSADTRQKPVELHRRLGLVCGAVDLIRSIDGRDVFLETNQAGEWGRIAAEIGTGTGWTAALLTRMGADVTTVEVAPSVAAQAAVNLKAAGSAPRLIIGDGTAGRPEGAPYDRVHATCAVSWVPYAWAEQTRPGGIIVTPWQPVPGYGWKLRLTAEGSHGVGRLHGPAGYMMLRAQRVAGRWNPHHAAEADTTRTRLDPRTVAHAGPGIVLAIAVRCPGVGMFPVDNDDGSFSLLLFETGNPQGAWASCDWEPDTADCEVTQYGERRLWDEVQAAFTWWTDNSSPGEERFGITVDGQGQRLQLRS